MKRPSENEVAAGKRLKLVDSQDLGVILSVTLQNFMCHDHLKFDFDPHINFIIGQNGSGKSAILTGIILALGGKSSVTGRYSNIKGFVKTGKNKARVSVTLKNCGRCAYKEDIFGNKIIVEREISIEGTSGYKLKTADGKIVSTLKDDLTKILIAMDIQVDNPVLVLTQETSRSFLMAKTGKEEKLYEFFYRGTGLQKLEDDYKSSVSLNEDSTRELAAKKQALESMEKDIKRLEKLRKSDEKLDELKREAFWARVIAMEQELEAKQIAKDKLVKDIQITKREAERSKNKYNEISLTLEATEKEKAEVYKNIETEKKSLEEFSRLSETCADYVRRCQGQVDLYKREENKLLEDIHVIQEAINEHQTKGQAVYENEKRCRNEQILILEERISSAEQEQAELEQQQQHLLQEQHSKQQEMNVLKSEINDLTYKKSMRDKEYYQLINSKKNRQFLFGEHTPQVLEAIRRNQHNFTKLPRGPIGLDIEVKDPKWNCAVETCIKPNMLRSFCVDNGRDSAVLTQILKQYYGDRMPSVIVSPFLPHVHNVSRHKAQTNIPTVLDMLKIKDPVIANCLIDQLSIENIILIEDITTANNIMLDNPPRQCYSAFLQNCDEILLNPYRFYSASRKPTNVLSQTVDGRYIEQVLQKINDLEAKIKEKENEMTEVRYQLQNYPAELKNLGVKIVELTSIKSDCLVAIEELKQCEEPRNVPEMHDEYASLKADLEKKQEELKNAEEKLADLKRKYKEAHGQLNRQKEIFTDLRRKYESLGNTINQHTKDKEVLASSKKEFETELKISERKLQPLEREIEEHEEKIKTTIAKRKEVDKKPRIRTKRPYEEIDVQIAEMQKVISEQSKSKDKASLLEKYNEKSKKLIEAKSDYNIIEGHNKTISKMMEKRYKKLKDIIRYTQLVIDFSFQVLLRGNEYTGGLNFDPKNKTLQLQATPNRKSSEGKRKKTCSSLSGGERSFVTIAFLIALWEKIQMPFRILDEYDVFMDSSNRHLSINLLITRASHMPDVQFIFLSPQDIPEVKDTNVSIKVHKMPPPQRIGLSELD